VEREIIRFMGSGSNVITPAVHKVAEVENSSLNWIGARAEAKAMTPRPWTIPANSTVVCTGSTPSNRRDPDRLVSERSRCSTNDGTLHPSTQNGEPLPRCSHAPRCACIRVLWWASRTEEARAECRPCTEHCSLSSLSSLPVISM